MADDTGGMVLRYDHNANAMAAAPRRRSKAEETANERCSSGMSGYRTKTIVRLSEDAGVINR